MELLSTKTNPRVRKLTNLSCFASQNPLLEDPGYRHWQESRDKDKKPRGRGGARCRLPLDRSKRIDVVSRYLFPLVFAVFNLAYWATYLTQANNEFEELSKIGSS